MHKLGVQLWHWQAKEIANFKVKKKDNFIYPSFKILKSESQISAVC